jgi:hypothetical protein
VKNEFILGVMFRGKPTHHLIKGAGEGHFFVNKAKLPAADIGQVCVSLCPSLGNAAACMDIFNDRSSLLTHIPPPSLPTLQVIEALHTKTPFWPVPLSRAVNVNASDRQGQGDASAAPQREEPPVRQPALPAAVESTPGGTHTEPTTRPASASTSRPLSREEDRPKSTASNRPQAFVLLPLDAEPAVFEDMPKSEMEGERLGDSCLFLFRQMLLWFVSHPTRSRTIRRAAALFSLGTVDGRFMLRNNSDKGMILSVIFRGKATSHQIEFVDEKYHVNKKPTTASKLSEVMTVLGSVSPAQNRSLS